MLEFRRGRNLDAKPVQAEMLRRWSRSERSSGQSPRGEKSAAATTSEAKGNSGPARASLPDSEQPPDRHHLTQVIRAMVGRQEYFPQIGLPFAMCDLTEEIYPGVGHYLR